MEESTTELMSHDEECCLKTALAFAVLRQRLEQNDNAAAAPAYLGGLMERTIAPSLPSCNTNTTDHLSKMMTIAISTAVPLCQKTDTTTMNDTKRASALQTLEGITKHLGLQLRNTTSVSMEWFKETLSNAQEIVAVSLVWHLILQAEPSVGATLLPAIGNVLQHLYHCTTSTTTDTALQMVKLLELVEASVSIRLSTTSSLELLQELSHAMGPELCLPIAKHDLAYFVLRSSKSNNNHGRNNAGNKILLRYCLYDLMEKLSAYNSSNHE